MRRKHDITLFVIRGFHISVERFDLDFINHLHFLSCNV